MRAELIDADGERRVASQADDPDLLWALRGGGGNFGVVTSLTYQLHPVGDVLAGMLSYPVSQAAHILHRVGEFAQETPDDLALIVMDDRRLTPAHALCLLVCWSGEAGQGRRIIGRIRALATPQADSAVELSYLELQRLLDAPPLEAKAVGEIDFISEINIETAQALGQCIANAPGLGCGFTLELLHGAACRVGAADTAFNVRIPGFFAYIMGAADADESFEQTCSWVEEVRRALGSVSTGDTYLNGLSMFGTPPESRVRSGYGANYNRLVALKNKYDPTNFFRMNQNIKPTV
jgi:FAD/FMN-containing dehydrogenase